MNNLDNAIKIYKSDNDIEKEFDNFKILSIEYKSGCSGWIEIDFPNGGESVGGGTNYIVDNWIKYPHNGKIAFNNWYPDKIYFILCNAINKKLKG